MNGLLFGVLVLCVTCMLVGYKKGFIRIVISLVSTIITIVLVGIFAPKVSDLLVEYTPLDDAIHNKFVTAIFEEIDEKVGDESDEKEEGEMSLEEQISSIEGADVPAFLKEALLNNNNNEIYEQLAVKTFSEYVGSYLANWVIKVIAFIVTFIIAIVIVRVLVSSLDIIAELPMLHGINRGIGTALGLGFALIIVWIGFLFLTIMYSNEFGQLCYGMMEESKLLTYLYENNPIMTMLIK